MNIDERIAALPGSNALEQEGMDDQIEEVKALISEVLAEVRPTDEVLPVGYDTANDKSPYWSYEMAEGYKAAIDEMERKQKELGL